MTTADVSGPRAIVMLDRAPKARSVTPPQGPRRRSRRWRPPEGIRPDDALAVALAARCETDCAHLGCQRNELLLRALWATGARISEVLAITPMHVLADSLVVPTLKSGRDDGGVRPWRRVYLPAGQADLPAALLVWANNSGLERRDPLFFALAGRGERPRGPLKPLTRQQGWRIVKSASERAGVLVLAMRPSKDGLRGEPAPIHPHIFRHARAREILRRTKNLPLAQRQLGWQQLHLEYLSLADDETRELMAGMTD